MSDGFATSVKRPRRDGGRRGRRIEKIDSPHTASWREMAAFSFCVLRPLGWAGLLIETSEDSASKHLRQMCKSTFGAAH
jgi:hypothetical protein